MAQDWPAKTVKIIVPFGAGSTPDVVARIIADQLGQKYPGSVFLVENKPGASGNLGTDVVAKAAPDGSTIGISIGGPLAINTLLFSNLPYNPQKDIAPVTQLITQPSALAVNPTLNVNSVADLIALLKEDPGKYNFASIGTGSLSQLAMEAIAIKSGTKIVHVPYKSSPQAILAVIRGDAQMACMPAISVLHAGQGRQGEDARRHHRQALALSARRADAEGERHRRRSRRLDGPDRAGRHAEGDGRQDQQGRGGDHHAAGGARKAAAQLMEPVGSTPEEFRARIDGEIARWAPVIKAANIKVN